MLVSRAPPSQPQPVGVCSLSQDLVFVSLEAGERPGGEAKALGEKSPASLIWLGTEKPAPDLAGRAPAALPRAKSLYFAFTAVSFQYAGDFSSALS